MECVLGIDLGTSYFKLALFDRDGRLQGLGRVPTPTIRTGPRHELPINDFQHSIKQALTLACRQAGATPAAIKAVSYSSQANTFFLLDQNLTPLTPLIVWTDGRASPWPATFEKLFSCDDFSSTTGLGMIAPEFAAAKLLWFRQNEPDLFRRTAAVMTISDYLTYLLTGRRAGDAATASLLGLWDLKNNQWWPAAFETLDTPMHWFSTMLRPGDLAGKTTPAAEYWLGIPAGTPFAAGTLDHHAAAIGAGIGQRADTIDTGIGHHDSAIDTRIGQHAAEVGAGTEQHAAAIDVGIGQHAAAIDVGTGLRADMSLSLGTVIACLRLQSDFVGRPDCCTGPDIEPGRFFQLAFNPNGAAALETYRDQHAPNQSIEHLLNLAADVPPGSNGLRFVPATGFVGVTQQNDTLAHHTRAILESVAAAARSLIENTLNSPIPHRTQTRLESGVAAAHTRVENRLKSPIPDRLLVTGGGARSPLWLQIIADLLSCQTLAADDDEPACRGAAMLAALVAGWFQTADHARRVFCRHFRYYSPNPDWHTLYQKWFHDFNI